MLSDITPAFRSAETKHDIGLTTKPDGNGALHRHGVQPGVGNVVPFAFEGNEFLGEQQLENVDLLLHASPAGVKIEPN